MVYDTKFAPQAKKEFFRLKENERERVLKAVLSLKSDPYIGKKLKGKFEGFYSLRVWPFRIIYAIRRSKCLIIVIRVAQRKDAYK